MNFAPDTSERRKRCEIYAVFGLLMKQFCVQHLWSISRGLIYGSWQMCFGGRLAGCGCNLTSKQKLNSRFRQFFHALSLPWVHFWFMPLCFTIFDAFTDWKNNCRCHFLELREKDDDPGRFILLAVVARIGSDMKEPQKMFPFPVVCDSGIHNLQHTRRKKERFHSNHPSHCWGVWGGLAESRAKSQWKRMKRSLTKHHSGCQSTFQSVRK